MYFSILELFFSHSQTNYTSMSRRKLDQTSCIKDFFYFDKCDNWLCHPSKFTSVLILIQSINEQN